MSFRNAWNCPNDLPLKCPLNPCMLHFVKHDDLFCVPPGFKCLLAQLVHYPDDSAYFSSVLSFCRTLWLVSGLVSICCCLSGVENPTLWQHILTRVSLVWYQPQVSVIHVQNIYVLISSIRHHNGVVTCLQIKPRALQPATKNGCSRSCLTHRFVWSESKKLNSQYTTRSAL